VKVRTKFVIGGQNMESGDFPARAALFLGLYYFPEQA
jgi:hypothetical protein